VSPFLDRALELSTGERAAFVVDVVAQDPQVGADLRELLFEHGALVREKFLETTPIAPLAPPAAAGQTIGAYTLVSQIGQGGMGTVWLAERSDGRFQMRAAVKFLSVALAGRGEDRFRREGVILARLTHPNIARLFDAGITANGQPYLVLEHVDGERIDLYCDRRALDVDARVRLFLDVLAALEHAHSNLIVHRDLKPSNVLVARDGTVKLLDFGIAKLLEEEGKKGEPTLLTREGGVALTPEYAAPEQITGEPVTTATDVYALGVLLYELLTGHHPAGAVPRSPAGMVKAIVDTEAKRPSTAVRGTAVADVNAGKRGTTPERLRRRLSGDLDTIVSKALKKNPAERYPSVGAFAGDLRRSLRNEPISARPDTLAYRASKFVRRNRLAVAVAALVVCGLSAGLYEVNRERQIAQRRFVLVRQLANKLFDIDVHVRQLPANSKARQVLVDTALDYLRKLEPDARGDPDLTLEIATAYLRVARVQGVPISSNLGQVDEAEQNLGKAEKLIESLLAVRTTDRRAMLRMAQVLHDRMILAGRRRPDDEALPLARRSAAWLERYLDAPGEIDKQDAEQLLITLNNVANRYRAKEEFDEALRLAGRATALAVKLDQPLQMGGLLTMTAMIHRDRGELDEALAEIRKAESFLEVAPGKAAAEQGRALSLALALSREASILGGDKEIAYGRSAEAIAPLRRSFQICDEFVHQDPADFNSRSRLSTAGIPLADLLRESDPAAALEVYDHVLRHLAEVKNNAHARREETKALSGSAYALRKLGRVDEAGKRLDLAFERLEELKLYPADSVDLGMEADTALRAKGDQQAAIGEPERAVATYDELLRLAMASKPKPETSMPDANDLSTLYADYAAVLRRAGKPDLAQRYEAQRIALWRKWAQKAPDNAFVRLQLAALRNN